MRKVLFLAAVAAAVALSGNVYARGSSYGGNSSYKSSYSYGSRSDHTISGYTRSNGTYVRPSHATNPDATRNNNYSTKGNLNPYTGKYGTKPRD
ncbi:hypothetical protein C1X61_01595 [Pseudomonas sp. FW215-T2]|nr:hypothetical protein C1X61_01595 [Pseudomonas sp. FW215-T2]PNA16826.1 hypothetical protein C1X62_01730 [Pseudomonas sp. FW215-R3]PNB39729.1 hypothetical protein C1X63_02190 [Pseudomonas sp. FW305-131]